MKQCTINEGTIQIIRPNNQNWWYIFNSLQQSTKLTNWSKSFTRKMLNQQKTLLIGYIKNNQYVGTIWLKFNRKSCHIIHFMVHPDEQNKGVGTELLKAAEKQAYTRNYQQISLNVKADNNLAQRFYKNNQFIIHHVQPRYYGITSIVRWTGVLHNLFKPIVYDDTKKYHPNDGFYCIKSILLEGKHDRNV